jgi:hypothetical protein
MSTVFKNGILIILIILILHFLVKNHLKNVNEEVCEKYDDQDNTDIIASVLEEDEKHLQSFINKIKQQESGKREEPVQNFDALGSQEFGTISKGGGGFGDKFSSVDFGGLNTI